MACDMRDSPSVTRSTPVTLIRIEFGKDEQCCLWMRTTPTNLIRHKRVLSYQTQLDPQWLLNRYNFLNRAEAAAMISAAIQEHVRLTQRENHSRARANKRADKPRGQDSDTPMKIQQRHRRAITKPVLAKRVDPKQRTLEQMLET